MRAWPWNLLAALAAAAAVAVALAVGVDDPLTLNEKRGGRLAIAVGALLSLPVYVWLRRRAGVGTDQPLWRLRGPGALALGSARWWLLAAMCGGSVYAVGNYYRFEAARVAQVRDYYDATYYYLNSKYFAELGYFELYPAMLVADDEGERRLRRVGEYRDLHTYELVPRARATAQATQVRARFSPARWAAFRADVAFLTPRMSGDLWSYFFSDHGYNPPPVWTMVGGALTAQVAPDELGWITVIDLVLVLLLFAAIVRVAGLDAGFYAGLFFLATFSGDWPLLGEAILRFDWLVAIVGAYLALRTERPALAGVLLAYATAVRVFPAVFVLPVLIGIGLEVVRTRRVGRSSRRFLAGGGLALAGLCGAALLTQGPGAFAESARNLRMHASPISYSSARVGLGDALIYRGEQSRQDLEPGGIPAKAEQLAALRPVTYGAAAAMVVLIILVARRRPAALDDLMPLGFLVLFCATTPQINYFNVRLLLVLWHLRDPARPRNLAALALLFAIEIACHAVELLGSIRYATTSVTSIGLVLYCALVAGSAWRESRTAS